MAYITTTLADLKVDLKQRVDRVEFWVDTELRLAINETLRDWNLFTGRWRRRIAITAGFTVHEYSLGATLTYGMAVKVLGRAAKNTSIWDLDYARPTWRGETTATGGDVPTVVQVWVPISLQQIALWPAPAFSTLNAITVDGVSATPVLVEDGDTVDLGEEHLDILLDYAAHVLLFKQGGPMWEATKPAYQAFLQAAAQENGRLKSHQVFRYAAGLNRRGDLRPAKDIPNTLDQVTAS